MIITYLWRKEKEGRLSYPSYPIGHVGATSMMPEEEFEKFIEREYAIDVDGWQLYWTSDEKD